jgi:hypothetical protein
LPMPGPVHVTLGPALTGKTMTLVDLAERDGNDIGTVTDFDQATYGPIVSVRLH